MRYITSPKHGFLNCGTESGVYVFEDKCKLAVAGDWEMGQRRAGKLAGPQFQNVNSALTQNDPHSIETHS
jgi:hypothetical protein